MTTLHEVAKRVGTSYQCDFCKGTFSYFPDEVWSVEQAKAEAVANNMAEAEDLVLVCDECYNYLMAEVKRQ